RILRKVALDVFHEGPAAGWPELIEIKIEHYPEVGMLHEEWVKEEFSPRPGGGRMSRPIQLHVIDIPLIDNNVGIDNRSPLADLLQVSVHITSRFGQNSHFGIRNVGPDAIEQELAE